MNETSCAREKSELSEPAQLVRQLSLSPPTLSEPAPASLMRLCLATIAMLLARGLALVPAKSLPLRSCARSPAPRSQTTRMVVG